MCIWVSVQGSHRGHCMLCEHNIYFARGDLFRKTLPHITAPSLANMAEAFWFNQVKYNRGKPPGCLHLPSSLCPVHQLVKAFCAYRKNACTNGKLNSYRDMTMFYHSLLEREDGGEAVIQTENSTSTSKDVVEVLHIRDTVNTVCANIGDFFREKDVITCKLG